MAADPISSAPEPSGSAAGPLMAQPLAPAAFIALVMGAAGLAASYATGAPETVRVLAANLAAAPLTAVLALIAWQVGEATPPRSRPQQAWQFIALASAIMVFGDLVLVVDTLLGLPTTESWAALGYFAYAPLVLCACLLLPPVIPSARERLKFGLDAATVVVGGAMIFWRFVIHPALTEPFSGSSFAFITQVCHPLGDLCLLLGIASILLRCPRGERRLPLVLLVVSQAVLLLSDDAWTRHVFTTGSAPATVLESILRLVQGSLVGAALLLEHQRLSSEVEDLDAAPRPFMALPYAAVVAGYGVLVFAATVRPATAQLVPLIVGAACLAVFVLARQILAVRENISLLRERTILASEARFKALIQHASDIVTIVDSSWVISFVSPSATRTLGYPASELVGVSFLGLLHHEDTVDGARRLREALLDPARVMTARWRLRRSDTTYIETDTICTNLMFDENIRGLVLTTRDVSERCSLEAQLRHQAFHDPLTGLANRALFQDRVQHALSRRRGELETLGVVFVDLDNFKTVNDSLGHGTGDLLLQAAAQRLVSCLRAFDTAARLGGDEFAVLIDDTQRYEDVPQVADRITKAFLDPFVIDGREVSTTASVGVALAMADQSAEDLLRNADLAMYLAKSRGRGQAALFEPSMHAAAVDRLELQNDLRHALERGELVVVYQPVHALESHELVGAEALLRWMHPTRGPIPPATFVPIAEETGLIVPIGRWVLKRACRDAVRWRAKNPEGQGLRVSINMSGRQIPDVDLLDDIRAALKESGLPAGAVVLELTESMLLQHTAPMMSLMHRLRGLGVRLAIDDFGTGYSSLSYLQRLPIDILKIDRAFVERLGTDANAAALVKAIVSLGESMSLKTIAEGIENPQQAERLRGLGCNYGQGFFFGMPMSADELTAYVDRNVTVGAA